MAVPQPRCRAADQHADDKQPDDQNEQRQVERQRRMLRAERVERHRHDLTVGHRKRNDDDGERYEDDGRNDLAEQTSGRSRFAAQPGLERLSRSRISLPVLKNGTHFWSTATWAPVRGLRPVRAGRCFTENAPKPRSSTRSPRAIAAIISLRMALTIFSTSRW